MNDISKVLLSIRRGTGLTQSGFAARIGLKQNTYSMIESGRNKPTIETLYSIINEFEVDANILFDKYKHHLISDNLPVNPVPVDANSDQSYSITGVELDEIIKYKLQYMDFYLLGISYHVRAIQESTMNIKFDKNQFGVEEKYIKNLMGNIIEGTNPEYVNYSVRQKLNLIKELDEATRQYLDNIWSITSKVLITI